MATVNRAPEGARELENEAMSPLALVPDFFERYFAFFRPGHQEGVVPSRIKELARLKVAALNDCDT
jgi:hypothetical protein